MGIANDGNFYYFSIGIINLIFEDDLNVICEP
jgi:hypothetical protein